MQDLNVNQGVGQVTPTGDWARITGVAARRQNLIRRLTTPVGALWYDPTYGNQAYGQLSQPATSAWLVAMGNACRQAAEQESGVRVVDVLVSRVGRQVAVRLQLIWDNRTADDLTVNL